MTFLVHHGSDLFSYDQQTCSSRILIEGDKVASKVEYDEYVVFIKPDALNPPSLDPRKHSESHITHRFSQDETSGATMLDLAFRNGYKLDRNGDFAPPVEKDNTAEEMIGRVRRVICFRRKAPFEGAPDLLSMNTQDVADLDLHPATLQYATRTGTESRFWSRDRSQLSLILSFSETPKTPCDFLSMTYNVHTRTTSILIRQSWEPRRHRLDDLDEYDDRLESCREHWAHPLVMPVILLQVQFMRCEEAVSENSLDVVALEEEVSSIAGFETDGGSAQKRPRRQLTGMVSGEDKPQTWGPMNMTNLMKHAHEVLRGTIKLLDTIRWMERAVKLLILAGDELHERLDGSAGSQFARDFNMGGDQFGNFERGLSPLPFLAVPGQEPQMPSKRASFTFSDEIGVHWHEIRQYLEGMLRLSMSLETERRMAEARCRAQIDIIYSKMAQEDNALNARMAVASSRDSSSMKALAVITAIFLPGEFIGTLFGMSMFDWLAPAKPEEEDASASSGKMMMLGRADEGESSEILSHQFWVYWCISIPLTLVIIFLWRAWWVTQDRYFRRHLSKELSEERFWTADGQPRSLDNSFLHDLFYLSARRDEKAAASRLEKVPTLDDPRSLGTDEGAKTWPEGPALMRTQTVRQRQILNARKLSLQKRGTAVAI